MSRTVDLTFEALFVLEDVRQLWRDTAPLHTLSAEQKKTLSSSVKKLRRILDDLEAVGK